MAGHAALGGRERRYHLRVWSFGSGSVAAAHHELMDAEGRHLVTSAAPRGSGLRPPTGARGLSRAARPDDHQAEPARARLGLGVEATSPLGRGDQLGEARVSTTRPSPVEKQLGVKPSCTPRSM